MTRLIYEARVALLQTLESFKSNKLVKHSRRGYGRFALKSVIMHIIKTMIRSRLSYFVAYLCHRISVSIGTFVSMQMMFKYLMLENSCHTILTVNIQNIGGLSASGS